MRTASNLRFLYRGLLAIGVACLAWDSAAACDTATIESYPPEPVAQCLESKITLEVGGTARCDDNLEQMATAGADAYAAKGNAAAAGYAGPMGGFFDSQTTSLVGVCAISCLKLPIGSVVADARAVTTVAASKDAPERRVYVAPHSDAMVGEAPYLSSIIVAQSTIGPLVCMAFANWQNRPANQQYMFYAYYISPPE